MALLSVTLLLLMTVLRAVFMLVHADYTQDRTLADGLKIGRASCRERVCLSV